MQSRCHPQAPGISSETTPTYCEIGSPTGAIRSVNTATRAPSNAAGELDELAVRAAPEGSSARANAETADGELRG